MAVRRWSASSSTRLLSAAKISAINPGEEISLLRVLLPNPTHATVELRDPTFGAEDFIQILQQAHGLFITLGLTLCDEGLDPPPSCDLVFFQVLEVLGSC